MEALGLVITIETIRSSSKGNAYILRSGERSLLLECGVRWAEIRRKLDYKTATLDGCLISHSHADHCGWAAEAVAASVDVYASQETLGSIGLAGHHRAHPLCHGKWYKIGDFWGLRPFATVHDTPGSLGFLIWDNQADHLLFITDTAYCRYRFPPVELIMIEANFSESLLKLNVDSDSISTAHAKRVRENHMGIERVLDFLKASDLCKCRTIHLLHGSDQNSDSALFKRLVEAQTGIPTFVEG